jgi:poly(A) polymerase Pap1
MVHLQGWVESRLRHLILKLETLLLKTGLAHPFPDPFQSPDAQERYVVFGSIACRVVMRSRRFTVASSRAA